MNPKVKITKDEIFEQSRARHLITVGFLKALKDNFSRDLAFKIALQGFINYMTEYYNLVLKSTEKGSQERFNRFRRHYEEYAAKCPYCNIEESTPTVLKVRYTRCPFAEVLSEYNLYNFAYAFCLSDPAFTKNVLSGVKFYREHEIVKGDSYCDHTWIFTK